MLPPSISLITASLDLQLVRLLRDAMRPVDVPGGAGPGLGMRPNPMPQSRPRVEPTPVIEPRPRITPQPRFEPREVVHPRPIEERNPAPCAPERPQEKRSPLDPPWKCKPWEQPAPPPPVPPKLKMVIQPADARTGTVLDLFI